MEEQKTELVCYETEMETQRAITDINRYKGWTAEKYKAHEATRTGNLYKEKTHTSSKGTETEKKK